TAYRLDPFDGQAVTGVALIRAMNGEWKDAIQFVNAQASHFPRDPIFAYNTACVYGRAIEYLQKPDSPEAPAETAKLQLEAIKKLNEARDYGFNQFDSMQRDPDLATLRDLPGFRQLIREE